MTLGDRLGGILHDNDRARLTCPDDNSGRYTARPVLYQADLGRRPSSNRRPQCAKRRARLVPVANPTYSGTP